MDKHDLETGLKIFGSFVGFVLMLSVRSCIPNQQRQAGQQYEYERQQQMNRDYNDRRQEARQYERQQQQYNYERQQQMRRNEE